MIEEQVKRFKGNFDKIIGELSKVIIGQDRLLNNLLRTIIAGGHILLEGVPGLGKTLMVRTLSDVFELTHSRIQFTPDLMPADIIGTNIIIERADGSKTFTFQEGPLFAQIVLADEINRATPKTQSALLEAMQEHSVTVGRVSHKLEEPFVVLATQNPIEMEGTYPLPEAQLDRFMSKILVKYPGEKVLSEIIESTTTEKKPKADKAINVEDLLKMMELVRQVPIASHVKDHISRLIYATHPDHESASSFVRKYVKYGSSPRGGQALALTAKVSAIVDGRYNVSHEDVYANLFNGLRHRLILSFEGEAEGIAADTILEDIYKNLPKE